MSGRGKNARQTSPERIARMERQTEAVALRKAGVGYPEIAKRLGVSLGCAWNYVNEYLVELAAQAREDAGTVRELERERLDEALLAIWNRVLEGELPAIDRFLRIQERRARLLGLDQPTQVTISGEVITESELDREIERLLADMASRTEAAPQGPPTG